MSSGNSKSKQAAVTVIVPTFNRANFIGESLDAILPQLQDDDELIVINDGSSDDTLAVLAAYGDAIKVISQGNSGKAAALNRALLDASGDLIWIVDDDDIVTDDARARLVAALESAPRAGFAYGRHDRFVDSDTTGERERLETGYWFDCEPGTFLCATLEDFFAHQPGMMVRKSVYDNVGPFSSVYSEDYDMLIRLAVDAQPVKVPGIVFHQRQHAGVRGSATSPIRIEERNQAWIKSSRDIVEKYMADLPLELFLPERVIADDVAYRHALFQRGVIFGRHGLWSKAANAFVEAVRQLDTALGQRDVALIRRISQSKFGMSSFLDDRSAHNAIIDLAKINPTGRAVVRAIGRSLVWRAREARRQRRWGTALRYTWWVWRLWIFAR